MGGAKIANAEPDINLLFSVRHVRALFCSLKELKQVISCFFFLTHIVKGGLDWISETLTGLLKRELVEGGLVKRGLVKQGLVKGGLVTHALMKCGLVKC